MPDLGLLAYRMLQRLGEPAMHALWSVRVEGREHIPEDGPAILASNHLAVFDSVFLPAVIDRRIVFVGKKEYWDDPKTRWIMEITGQIPVDRSGGEGAQRALDAAASVLERGELFGIYPEGTRSPDGRLYKGHTGVARLTLRTGAPVIPVAMIGTREINPPGEVVLRPFLPLTIRIGRPMRFGHEPDGPADPRRLRQITDEIMYEIRELSGQEYVDRYAKKRSEDLAPEPARVPVTPRVPDGALSVAPSS